MKENVVITKNRKKNSKFIASYIYCSGKFITSKGHNYYWAV